MIKLNLLNKLIRKIAWRKKQTIKDVKKIIIFFILYFFLFGLFMPSITLLQCFFYLSFIFLSISILYYAFFAKNDEFILIRSMWKTYFSIISLMFIMIFSIESYTHNILFNSYKQKIIYQLKNDNLELNSTINEYESIINQYLSGYKKEKVNYRKIFTAKEKVEKEYTLWYTNVAYTIMIITTLFMFLWILNELSYFKVNNSKIDNNYLKK